MSKIEKLYYRSIHWSKSTSIVELFIIEEYIKIYIEDVLSLLMYILKKKRYFILEKNTKIYIE